MTDARTCPTCGKHGPFYVGATNRQCIACAKQKDAARRQRSRQDRQPAPIDTTLDTITKGWGSQ